MSESFLRQMHDQLQRERRAVVEELKDADETFHAITETRQPERDEEAQQERDRITVGPFEDRQQKQLADIDTALAKIDAGSYGTCANCGRPIGKRAFAWRRQLIGAPTARKIRRTRLNRAPTPPFWSRAHPTICRHPADCRRIWTSSRMTSLLRSFAP